MKPRPYIGVTGFKAGEEIKSAIEEFEAAQAMEKPSDDRTLMVGFLCSEERLAEPNRPGNKSPALAAIPDLACLTYCKALPMVHYHSKNKETLHEQLRQIFLTGDLHQWCKHVQLNVDWPSPTQMQWAREDFPALEYVLQLPKRATDGLTVRDVASRCADYAIASYVLIDPSGGKGVEFDINQGVELMHAVSEALPNATIGIAGGFCPENVSGRVSALRSSFNHGFCIDAQGRLYTGNSLDTGKVSSYIAAACQAFSR